MVDSVIMENPQGAADSIIDAWADLNGLTYDDCNEVGIESTTCGTMNFVLQDGYIDAGEKTFLDENYPPKFGNALYGKDGTRGRDRRIKALVKALGDKDARVRKAAKGPLIDIGVAAVPALIEALGDEAVRLNSSAHRPIVKIGLPAVPALLKALEDTGKKEEIREDVAWVLGKIGPLAAECADTIPALHKVLANENESEDVREATAWALAQIDKKEETEMRGCTCQAVGGSRGINLIDLVRSFFTASVRSNP